VSLGVSRRLGVVGARGYAGGELLRLVAGHGGFELGYAASRALVGKPVTELAAELDSDLLIAAPDPEAAASAGLDACVLALPNGKAAPYVEAFDRLSPQTVLVDFSADYRGADGWVYGLPELGRADIRGATRIANPGCYATAVQLALAPLAAHMSGPASAFGVSGWSGAGTSPSPRNDEARLSDNIMPYAMAQHGHEIEIRAGLGVAVNFTPHVAGYFRGLLATVHAPLRESLDTAAARELYAVAYDGEPLIQLTDEPPEVRDARDRPIAVVGGVVAVPSERRVVAACALDNLLKGAASQALQNLNLALGFDETQGLGLSPSS